MSIFLYILLYFLLKHSPLLIFVDCVYILKSHLFILMTQKDNNDEVEELLVDLLGHLDDAMSSLEQLNDDSRKTLIDSSKKIIDAFDKLRRLSFDVQGSVPIELLRQIDEGNNPEAYSKYLVEKCKEDEQKFQQKQKDIKVFLQCLDEKIREYFPDECV